MNILQKLEYKFGHKRIPNLIYVFMGLYLLGYILSRFDQGFINSFGFSVLDFLYFSPSHIIHRFQFWRLFTWLIYPSNSNFLMMALMLFIYISIAKTLEQVVGTFKLNFYLITGLLLQVIAGFIFYFVFKFPDKMYVTFLNPYYIYASLFILFALMFPTAHFRLMFIIPISGKWLVLVSAIMYFIDVVQAFMMGAAGYAWLLVFMIVAAILNIMLFMYLSGFQFGRRRASNTVNMNSYQRKQERREKQIVYRHKCAVCGRTEKTNPELDFRYCSKCHGNHEYCMEHLYTHTHIVG